MRYPVCKKKRKSGHDKCTKNQFREGSKEEGNIDDAFLAVIAKLAEIAFH